MKKITYMHYGIKAPGLIKKLNAQIFELEKYFEVEVLDASKYKNDNRSLMEKIMSNSLIVYKPLYNYEKMIERFNKTDVLYIRRDKADKYFIKFLNDLKQRYTNLIVLLEIPTYPYIKDEFYKFRHLPKLLKELNAIKKFDRYIDRIVTYSNDEEIFDIKTLKVKNGVYVEQFRPRNPYNTDGTKIHLLAVATFRKHHGYERIIKGLYDYYSHGGTRDIVLNMVGNGEELYRYKKLVEKYRLQNCVIFLGEMTGEDLSMQYDLADIALGSFGLYKIDISTSSVLKVREYLAKGLPIVSGCHEDAFEDERFEYYLEFPNDNSVVDINKIVDFYDRIYLSKSEDEKDQMVLNIRKYAKRRVDYDVVFQNVIDYLKGEINENSNSSRC